MLEKQLEKKQSRNIPGSTLVNFDLDAVADRNLKYQQMAFNTLSQEDTIQTDDGLRKLMYKNANQS